MAAILRYISRLTRTFTTSPPFVYFHFADVAFVFVYIHKLSDSEAPNKRIKNEMT